MLTSKFKDYIVFLLAWNRNHVCFNDDDGSSISLISWYIDVVAFVWLSQSSIILVLVSLHHLIYKMGHRSISFMTFLAVHSFTQSSQARSHASSLVMHGRFFPTSYRQYQLIIHCMVFSFADCLPTSFNKACNEPVYMIQQTPLVNRK
jgi:hypothetical protein